MMLSVNELPYLTSDVPGLGGEIKSRPEDFRVREVPLYEPGGEGTHIYMEIEKAGLATMAAIRELARALNCPPREFGYAGLKDANAVTTQMISIEHVDPSRVLSLSLPRIRILRAERHTNKLKLGHLAANRFELKLRGVDPARAGDVRAVMDDLTRRGVPNYFGQQRFGMRGDTWEIGRAMLRGEFMEAVALMLGRPGPLDSGEVRKARMLFEQQQYSAASRAWPFPFRSERILCKAMGTSNGNAARAFKTVDKQLRRFFVSAYQSQLFNQIVAQRLRSLDRLMSGDLAWKHRGGAVFEVKDVSIEQPRCDAFEISPSGPLYGYRMSQPTGEPGAMEEAVIGTQGMAPEDWYESGRHRVKGARRPLRFQPRDTLIDGGRDDAGPFIRLCFELDPGCYATTVMREVCKSEIGHDSEENVSEK